MDKKYELIEETKQAGARTLYRIKALKDFGTVEKGDLGGFVESEKNLSQEGACWVFDNARVYGNARVFDNAQVYDNARVFDNAQVYDNARVYGNARVKKGEVTKRPINIVGLYYNVTIYNDLIQIGCELHSVSEWENFTDRRILEMDGKKALEFWKVWKDTVIGTSRNWGKSNG